MWVAFIVIANAKRIVAAAGLLYKEKYSNENNYP